jgi:protein TonB
MLTTATAYDETGMRCLQAEGMDGDAGPPIGGLLRPEAADHQIVRHGYQPTKGGRIFGGFGSTLICVSIGAAFLVTMSRVSHPGVVSAPLVVTFQPAAQPTHPQSKPTEKQKPVTKQLVTPEPAAISSPRPVVADSNPSIPIAPAQIAQAPKPQATQSAPTPPPQPAAAPPTPPQSSSHGPDKWEGRVLARLERFRHYPADAEHARQQGTAYIRFRIDRSGHVLSSSLDRSSGIAALDAAAMETLRRADPLPKIPPDRPDQIELVVPIEFFISR